MGKSRREQFGDHLDLLSDEDRERALHTIVGQVYLAVEGVDLQARRLRASHSVIHTEHQSDAIFLIVALQRLMLLLDLALELAPEDRRAELANAIDRLRASAGDTEDARDVLAHLDEYLTRFGKKQAKAGELPLPWFERSGTRYVVRVGSYAVSVDEAEEAAHEAFAAAFPLDSL